MQSVTKNLTMMTRASFPGNVFEHAYTGLGFGHPKPVLDWTDGHNCPEPVLYRAVLTRFKMRFKPPLSKTCQPCAYIINEYIKERYPTLFWSLR